MEECERMSVVYGFKCSTYERNTIRHLSFICWEISDTYSLWENYAVWSIKLVAVASHFNSILKFSDDKLIVLFEATKTHICSFAYLVHLFGFLHSKPNRKNLTFPPSPPKVAQRHSIPCFYTNTQNKYLTHFFTCSSNVLLLLLMMLLLLLRQLFLRFLFVAPTKIFM